jgi:hypothetical protein
MVRFVTAVPAGTPDKSVTPAVLNQTALRALVAATSALKTVPSGMRYKPSSLPSRSETAIVILAVDPMGRRMTARVMFAVATALVTISLTSLCESPESATGPTKYPSGGRVPAAGSYQNEKVRTGNGEKTFLEKCLHKLLMNFAWWVNRVDSTGNNIFEGGFLGLDNITVVDRSEKLPGGAILEQSDATGWMGFFCLYLLRAALELANFDKAYELLATKFFEHFIYVGAAMKKMGGRNYQLWDEQDGFFYDVLRLPNGDFSKFRLRSMVGLIPLYAVEVIDREDLDPHPEFLGNVEWFIRNRPDLVGNACYSIDGQRYVLSIADSDQFARVLQYVWDPKEFLAPHGIRSLSKYHERHPCCFGGGCVGYEPGESTVRIKGGNSNWRGPLWFPTTYLLIRSLLKFSRALEPDFAVRTPGSNGEPITPFAMAGEIADRMIGLFRKNEHGHRFCWVAIPASPSC